MMIPSQFLATDIKSAATRLLMIVLKQRPWRSMHRSANVTTSAAEKPHPCGTSCENWKPSLAEKPALSNKPPARAINATPGRTRHDCNDISVGQPKLVSTKV